MNLQQMIDGSLELNVKRPEQRAHAFKAQQEVLIRRRVNNAARTPTTEVIVGRILAMNGNRASISVPRPGGITQRMEVDVRDLQPVTESFRRSSVQYSPAFRGRM